MLYSAACRYAVRSYSLVIELIQIGVAMLRILSFACFLLLAGPAAAEKRTAFIVGNADYVNGLPLANPVNDAQLVAGTLVDLDFEVTLATDLSRADLAGAFSDFLERTTDADITLFYYAGHGMQFEGRNYLLGTDAALRSKFDVQSEALPLDRIVQMLEAKSRAALVFIDACRDNPLATEFYTRNYSATRALATRGLTSMNTRFEGSMIMFAASPGQVAYDGTSRNSPFTKALAQHLPTNDVEILTLMKRVIRDVKADTEDQQIPMVTNDLALEVYLSEQTEVEIELNDETAARGETADLSEDELFAFVSKLNSPRAWELFLEDFPHGSLRRDALFRHERLQGTNRELAVMCVQRQLRDRGFYKGKIDGDFGAGTARALNGFRDLAHKVYYQGRSLPQVASTNLAFWCEFIDGTPGVRNKSYYALYQGAISID
ncbi:caspase family protein [Tropicimonas sp. S265A]|uniref:caspase family protein n=1 Tax=Tropicimonas sp. S265A TaxID=3415134 RepID=UPI003C7C1175